MSMMDLARESDKKKTDEGDLWRILLKHRWSTTNCLRETQITEVIVKTRQELKIDLGSNTWLPNDDLIKHGFKMYAALLYCPDQRVENKRLSLFFESLLTHHSLSTVVAATVNSLKAKRGNDIDDYTAINLWYKELDARYNLSLGPTVIALSTSEQLDQLAKFDLPYLTEYNECVNCHSQERTACEEFNLSGNINLTYF